MTGVREYTIACQNRCRARVLEICEALKFSHADVVGPSRAVAIVGQRRMVGTILRSEDFTYLHIAHGLCRDHSSIVNLLNDGYRDRKQAYARNWHHRKGRRKCQHDFKRLPKTSPYKDVHSEKCSKCGFVREYEQDYT